MINEEKVILMTRMAAYEQHEEKRNTAIGNFFRSDYVGFQVLKSVISATIVFAILFGVYIFYDFEVFMHDIYKMDLIAFGKKVLLYYSVFVGGYALITYIVHAFRFKRARRSLRSYYNNLRRMLNMYEKQA